MAEREADLRERAQGHLAERAAETGQRWWGECGDGRGASGTTRAREASGAGGASAVPAC